MPVASSTAIVPEFVKVFDEETVKPVSGVDPPIAAVTETSPVPASSVNVCAPLTVSSMVMFWSVVRALVRIVTFPANRTGPLKSTIPAVPAAPALVVSILPPRAIFPVVEFSVTEPPVSPPPRPLAVWIAPRLWPPVVLVTTTAPPAVVRAPVVTPVSALSAIPSTLAEVISPVAIVDVPAFMVTSPAAVIAPVVMDALAVVIEISEEPAPVIAPLANCPLAGSTVRLPARVMVPLLKLIASALEVKVTVPAFESVKPLLFES